jgi:ubiquinone/menaquinone biosynthesis C-methylase UbiE
MSTTQHDLAKAQFGPQASAYVSSRVHAAGEDLARLRTLAASKPGGRALDLGAGGGHVAYALASHAGEVVACDLSPQIVAAVEEEARRRGLPNVATAVAPAERLPFEDASFDLLASRFSAHHWADLALGLREARRVLKPGGTAVFIDIVSPAAASLDTHLQAVELLRDPSHGRDYRLSEWTSALEFAGFRVDEVFRWRLRMEFSSWTARINTPPESMAAIRKIQSQASDATAAYFAIAEDGSFDLDAAWLQTTVGDG